MCSFGPSGVKLQCIDTYENVSTDPMKHRGFHLNDIDLLLNTHYFLALYDQ